MRTVGYGEAIVAASLGFLLFYFGIILFMLRTSKVKTGFYRQFF